MLKKLVRNKIKSAFKESLGFPPILPLPKEACREEEKLKGGLADGKTLKDLANDHKVSLSDIVSQVEKGKDVEAEHSDDPDEQKEIAKDHVSERPDYYDALDAAGIDESIINEMPYFYDVPMGDGTVKDIDMQIEKYPTEKEFESFLIGLLGGEQQGIDDPKQPEMQMQDPGGFLNMMLSFNFPPNVKYESDRFFVEFTRAYRSSNPPRKVTPKSVTEEDAVYFRNFVKTAASKSTLRYA